MKSDHNRPTTVPQEAVWDPTQNEWELGARNAQGKMIGEWKWWLAPTGHLCCHTIFNDEGAILSFKRFHPNGEVSREGLYEDGRPIRDVYYKSSEPTTEIFAYGNTEENVFKAVKRSGVPVSFDYYDKEGNHLNPPIEQRELLSEEDAEIPEEEVAAIKDALYQNGKGFLRQQFDKEFYLGTILPLIEQEEQKRIVDDVIDNAISSQCDVVFHEGDLHLTNLHCLSEMEVGVLIVHGDLTVDGAIALSDDPSQLLLVTGAVKTNNLTTSGILLVFGDVAVHQCLIGDYNHGFAYIGGHLKARFFYPEEYFFEVVGEVDFDCAFGNSWRLNENQTPEAFNYNDKKLSEFVALLHEDVLAAADFEHHKSALENPCEEGDFFEFIESGDLMDYVMMNKPLFKN